MDKKIIRTAKDLDSIKSSLTERMAIRGMYGKENNSADGQFDVMLCMGTSCISSGAKEIKSALEEEIQKNNLQEKVKIHSDSCPGKSGKNAKSGKNDATREKVKIVETGCNGFCAAGPIMVIYPGGYFYQKVKVEDVKDIVSQHFISGRPIKRLMYHDKVTGEAMPFLRDIPFFAKQKLKVLRNKGRIAAQSIDEYIGREGYSALARALHELEPEAIIDEIKQSGLRGRGGAGFPTGMKWHFASQAQSSQKYIVCNADEGDPGAFMDRSVLESDPHALIEGMLIGAKAIGANEGVIYVRAEYPLAIVRLQKAIDQARENGFLGNDIFETGFDFDLRIKAGAGAFVCGEETALIASLEGERGMPRLKPPFPAQKGYWNAPTNINNVETFANVPWIFRNGGEAYAALGTAESKGTKVFALTGKVKRGGLVEIPMGLTLRDVIYEIGGGIKADIAFKAVQMGGPSGGCIPASLLDTQIDYAEITKTGASWAPVG